MTPIPSNFPVQPIKPDDPNAVAIASCGVCGRHWDDGRVTSMTPAPAARCPFEAFHEDEDTERSMQAALDRQALALGATERETFGRTDDGYENPRDYA